MSGISGLCSNGEKIKTDERKILVQKMLHEISHRAPDADICDCGDNTVFGIRYRNQSEAIARDDEKGLTVIIDGWIYNSPLHGSDFSIGYTEAEIILKLYSQYGTGFLDKIDGSYAIAIWDARKKQLLLARDRLGYKPLFYNQSGSTILFASEIKSILTAGIYRKSVNLRAVNDFLSYGYVPNPETLFEGIIQVKPGHCITFKDNTLTEKAYWRFQYHHSDYPYNESEYLEKFIDLLKTAVARRLKRHSGCGSFLSGGLDTSAVVAVMHELLKSPFKVFTAGFEEEQYNETPDARIVADHLGLEHLSVTIKFQKDLHELLEKIVWHHDAPFADTSAVPSFFAAEFAKKHLPVVLTGDFPDQLIGGSGHQVAALTRQQSDSLIFRMLRNKFFNKIVSGFPLAAGGTNIFDRVKRMIYRETFPLEEQRILLNMPVPDLLKKWLYDPGFLQVHSNHNPIRIARSLYEEVKNYGLLDKILYFDTLSYAPDDLMVKVERMTMAHGLVAISPFHDREFVDFIAGIPADLKIRNGSTKYIMREAIRPLLPEETLNKKKKGFDMPIDVWLVKRSPDFVRDILLDSRSLGRSYFNKGRLNEMVGRFLAEKTDYASGSAGTIISMITLELWHRIFID
ncbi:MAG: asparagine synthase (glutamine-hydrolyzing) [Syntrophaceae bacterium]|nr:asparagine synthase (glutamine-hydrolyzing) [Syntrophaceae bacterium]